MAIFKPTAIAGGTRKSVDNLTFCRTRGRNVVKTKVGKNTSNTFLQQKQRARWVQLQELSAAFDEAILVGFPSRPDHLTPHNAFLRKNAKAVKISDELEATVAFEKMVCSEGKLLVPSTTVTAEAEQHRLTFTHDSESYGKRRMPNDLLHAIVIEKSINEGRFFPLNKREEDEPVSVTLPASWDMENLGVYVFVLSENGHKASNTLYLGMK